MDREDFKYVKLNMCDIDLNEYIKDDTELLKFIKGYDKSCKVIYYKNKPIGFIYEGNYMGNPEFQCALFKEFRGLGISKYLLENFKRKKFEDNYKRVVLLIDKENKMSIKSAEKNGYRLDDTFEEINPDNKETPYYVYYQNNPNYKPKGR